VEGGRLAMADAFLARPPAGRDEEAIVAKLEDSWGARLTTVDEWRCSLESHGCRVVHVRDVKGDCGFLEPAGRIAALARRDGVRRREAGLGPGARGVRARRDWIVPHR